jgi:hypothetical protein
MELQRPLDAGELRRLCSDARELRRLQVRERGGGNLTWVAETFGAHGGGDLTRQRSLVFSSFERGGAGQQGEGEREGPDRGEGEGWRRPPAAGRRGGVARYFCVRGPTQIDRIRQIQT